jgi:hypothetical protein
MLEFLIVLSIPILILLGFLIKKKIKNVTSDVPYDIAYSVVLDRLVKYRTSGHDTITHLNKVIKELNDLSYEVRKMNSYNTKRAYYVWIKYFRDAAFEHLKVATYKNKIPAPEIY